MIRFVCTCGHRLEVPDDEAGNSLQCPKCGLLVDVPTLSELQNFTEDGAESGDPSLGLGIHMYTCSLHAEMRGTIEGFAARLAAERGVGGIALGQLKECVAQIDDEHEGVVGGVAVQRRRLERAAEGDGGVVRHRIHLHGQHQRRHARASGPQQQGPDGVGGDVGQPRPGQPGLELPERIQSPMLGAIEVVEICNWFVLRRVESCNHIGRAISRAIVYDYDGM